MGIKLHAQEIDGLRVLTRVPEYMMNVNIKEKDMIIEMGDLNSFKRFMHKYTDFTDANRLSSMKEDEWAGVKTWDEYQTLLDEGDEKVMKKLKIETKTQLNILHKKYDEIINGYTFDVTGEFFDVGLVLTGVPETWLNPEMEEVEQPQVDIMINGTFSANTRKEDVVKQSSRILAITKILEENGVQVKIKIVSCIENYKSRGKSKNLFVATDVKDYNEPINYKKISALVSPTYLRRGVFKVMEVICGNSVGYGYGYAKHNIKGFTEVHHERDVNALERKLFKKDEK